MIVFVVIGLIDLLTFVQVWFMYLFVFAYVYCCFSSICVMCCIWFGGCLFA